MVATWTAFRDDGPILSLDRPDGIGVGFSMVLPLAGLVIVHAVADAAGLTPAVSAGPFGLPAWVGAVTMMVMLPMWGLARWLVSRQGHEGRIAGWWIVTLMGAAMIAPFAMAATDTFFASVVSMLVLLIGIVAAGRAAAVSGAAAALLLPGLVLTGTGALLGFSVVAGGWSPPFALTDTQGR